MIGPWVGTVARLVLGVVFMIAGLSKVNDLAESGRAVAAYEIFSYETSKIIGVTLPFLEIALGLLLIVGLGTRLASIAGALLFGVFIIGIAQAWYRGLRIDCGCFGGGGALAGDQEPSYAAELIRDVGLVILAGFLSVFPRTRVSVDSWLLDGGSEQ